MSAHVSQPPQPAHIIYCVTGQRLSSKMGVSRLVLLRQSGRPMCKVHVHDRVVSRFLGYLKIQSGTDLCHFNFTGPCNAFRCNSILRPHRLWGPHDLACNADRGKHSPGVKAAGMLS